MKKILIENIIKNLVTIILLFILYQPVSDLFERIDPVHYGNLLVTISLLIMAVLFAAYTFTYAHTKMERSFDRYLSHITTFIITLCTGLMLESVVVLVNLETSINVWVVTFVSSAFFVSLIMFDFWDLFRAKME